MPSTRQGHGKKVSNQPKPKKFGANDSDKERNRDTAVSNSNNNQKPDSRTGLKRKSSQQDVGQMNKVTKARSCDENEDNLVTDWDDLDLSQPV